MMKNLTMSWGIIPPMLALAATGPACASGGGAIPDNAAGDPPRALALNVQEMDDSVEVQIVANSMRAQQIEYAIELVGSSRSRHKGSTTIAADETQVLSRLKTGFQDSWCATLDVTEGDGTSYTLTAGDCSTDT